MSFFLTIKLNIKSILSFCGRFVVLFLALHVLVNLDTEGYIFTQDYAYSETKKAETKPAERTLKRKKKETKKDGAHEEIVEPKAKSEETEFPAENKSAQLSQVVDTILILDSSRSMKKTDPSRLRDQGAKLFLQFLEAEDRISIIEFSDQSNTLLPLTQIKDISNDEINSVLQGIKDEGNFTNFLSPLSSALETLLNSGKEGVPKVVIFLTDGQMDPSGDPAVRDTLLAKLRENTLPEYSKSGIKIFSLALSSLADRDLLEEISKKTGGFSSYAEDVNSIHKVFSDLFLSIKRPQVLELDKGGFQIDGDTKEATFFINRKLETDTVTVVDPSHKEYVNKDFPVSWKWFRGDLFDVITIPKPLPGRWLIRGASTDIIGDDLSGFAKLLSNLKLEYSFPGPSFSVGDKAVLKVRVVEDGKILDSKELQGLIFFTYRIIDTKSGQIYDQGQLLDTGEHGDETANDFIFSNTITLNEESDFKLYLAANGPTFVRQAQIPISVSKGIITIEHIPANEFTQVKDVYRVVVRAAGKKLTNKVVYLQAKSEGQDLAHRLNLENFKTGEDIYTIPLEKLNSGENKILAIINGVDSNKEKISAQSEEIKIIIPEHAEKHDKLEEGKDGHVEILDDHTETVEEASPSIIYGILSILVSTLVSFFFGKFLLNKSNSEGGVKIVVRPAYTIPEDLIQELENLKKLSTSSRRAPYQEESEIFKLVPEISESLSHNTETSSDTGAKSGSSNISSSDSGTSSESIDEKDSNKTEEMSESE